MFYFPICKVTDLNKLLRQPSHPNTPQCPHKGFPLKESPQRLPVWHQSSHLACNSNQEPQWGTADAEIKNPPWWAPRAIKGSLFLSLE